METIIIDERETAIDAIVSDVQASAVRLVRFLFCDTAGIIRGKTTSPPSHLSMSRATAHTCIYPPGTRARTATCSLERPINYRTLASISSQEYWNICRD